jgi:hypothetical protein
MSITSISTPGRNYGDPQDAARRTCDEVTSQLLPLDFPILCAIAGTFIMAMTTILWPPFFTRIRFGFGTIATVSASDCWQCPAPLRGRDSLCRK